jgi:hypothetical protein
VALTLPTPAQATLQTPLNTYSPTSGPLINTTNGFTYVYDPVLGVWTGSAGGGGSTVTAATLAEAAAGTINTKYSSPETAVPKSSSGMTGAALIPGGNDGARPSPVTGMLRYNNQGGTPVKMEYYDGAAWSGLGGGGGNMQAWVNCDENGVIRSSGNVSSVSSFGSGLYGINFTTAMVDANYAVAGAAGQSTSSGRRDFYVSIQNNGLSTTQAQVLTIAPINNFASQCQYLTVIIVR